MILIIIALSEIYGLGCRKVSCRKKYLKEEDASKFIRPKKQRKRGKKVSFFLPAEETGSVEF